MTVNEKPIQNFRYFMKSMLVLRRKSIPWLLSAVPGGWF
jgi:hypothetical protein